MNRIGKLVLVAGILAIALAVPMAVANVIYLYKAQVNVMPVTPIVWLYGPDHSNVGLSLSNTSPQVTLTIPITNSSETYVYQALEVKVNSVWTGPWYLYVDSCTYSGPTLTSVELIVYPTTGSPSSPTGTITITPGTSCSFSGSVELSAGTTYYIDFVVEPSLPIPHSAGSGTLTIYFGLSNESAQTVPAP